MAFEPGAHVPLRRQPLGNLMKRDVLLLLHESDNERFMRVQLRTWRLSITTISPGDRSGTSTWPYASSRSCVGEAGCPAPCRALLPSSSISRDDDSAPPVRSGDGPSKRSMLNGRQPPDAGTGANPSHHIKLSEKTDTPKTTTARSAFVHSCVSPIGNPTQ